MDNVANWIMDITDFFYEFITENVDVSNVAKLCNVLDLPDIYSIAYATTSLENIVLLHGSSDENYTSNELFYLKYGQKVVIMSSPNASSFIYIELNGEEYELDLVACAITKIVKKAFGNDILICFKSGYTIAFGAATDDGNSKYGYCLSRWYSVAEIIDLVDLCVNNFGDLEAITYSIVRSSKIMNSDKDYDTRRYDYDYAEALREIGRIYHIDLNSEIERYHNSYFAIQKRDQSFSEIFTMLEDIGVSEMSSYDYLRKAEKLEIHDSIVEYIRDNSDLDSETFQKIQGIPDDIFNDAKKMLEYIECH